jgi:hypothetical protein
VLSRGGRRDDRAIGGAEGGVNPVGEATWMRITVAPAVRIAPMPKVLGLRLKVSLLGSTQVRFSCLYQVERYSSIRQSLGWFGEGYMIHSITKTSFALNLRFLKILTDSISSAVILFDILHAILTGVLTPNVSYGQWMKGAAKVFWNL